MSSRWLLLLLPPLTSSIGPPLAPLAPGLPFAPVDRVVVCAGTHGNEFAGIYVLERLRIKAAKFAARYPTLSLETLMANPLAHQRTCRFVDEDLNRMFSLARLSDPSAASYEANRAKVISALLGPKCEWPGIPGDGLAADLVIDLHTTTANMGCTIIIDSWCSLGLRVAAYVSDQWEVACTASEISAEEFPLRVLMEEVEQVDSPYLCSAGRNGLMIEVGPTPQGLLRAKCITATELALALVLEYVDLCNQRKPPVLPASLEVYVDVGHFAWPNGTQYLPGGVVHPSLQDADFVPIAKGDPVYTLLDGTEVSYDGSWETEVVPIFVNEAAYYNSESGAGIGIAMIKELLIDYD